VNSYGIPETGIMMLPLAWKLWHTTS